MGNNNHCCHKLAKINLIKLYLSQEQIVDCVIGDVKDQQIKVTIRAIRCSTFVELSEFSNFPCTSTFSKRNIKNKVKTTVHVNNERQIEIIYFNCNEKGHKRSKCPKYNNSKCIFCDTVD